METIKRINLIHGSFNPTDANELLMDLYKKNINFNKIKNFSSQVRYGVEDHLALEQIEDLKENAQQIEEIIQEARANHKNLVLKSYLDIEFEDQ